MAPRSETAIESGQHDRQPWVAALVQTRKALIDVFGSSQAREVFEGKAMMDWRGQLYRQSK